MTVALKRIVSLMLMLALVLSMVPAAFAAEAETEPAVTATTEVKETVQETTAPTEEAETDAAGAAPPQMEAPVAGDGMLRASTISNVTLFDQASPNYTTYLSSQIAVTYKPNGTGSSVTAYLKNMGWHFARINGVSYPNDPIYCIEPHKNYGASTSGNYVDNGVTVSGSGSSHGADVWYSMPTAYREAITLILLYSSQRWNDAYTVSNTSMANNPNVPLRIATQFLIYEIVTGLRDASTFERKSSNGYTNGDVYYNAGVANVTGFASHYNAMVDSIQAAMEIPSFTSKDKNSAPTIDLTGDETVIRDYNGVLGNFKFTDGNGAEFYKSGNDLYITQVGSISESTVFSCSRNLPSATASSVAIYYGAASTYQSCVKLYSPSSGSLNAYFKLSPPAMGSFSLTKTTEDGKNLAGWRFEVYADAACTNKVAGPYTTFADGKFSVADMDVGTFYIKEIGHKDPAINALYTCASTNPQRVTITSGGTASVSFYNKLTLGGVKLAKSTNTGENLSGWQIGLYTDSGCTTPITGSPFTTGADGTISVTGLKPGTYYAREIPVDDPYWQCDTSVKTVTVSAGQTESVTFTNTHLGKIEFQKTTNTGKNLDGWTFRVIHPDLGVIGDFTTDENGYACTGYLLPGRYTIYEIGYEDEYWVYPISPHDVTVVSGEVSVDKWTNLHVGNLSIVKTMEGDGPIEGWQFKVTDSDGNEVKGSPFTTNKDGLITDKLLPGTYTVEELIPEGSLYYCKSENPQTVTIVEGTNAEVKFTNALRRGNITIEKVDTNGKPLAGAKFLLEWSEDGVNWVPVHYAENGGSEPGGCSNRDLVDGCLVSGEDGILEWKDLHPDLQYRITEVQAPEGYTLLKDYAFQGELPKENPTIQLRVVNGEAFMLPQTGSNTLMLMPMIASLCAVLGMGIFVCNMKNKRNMEEKN